MTIYEHGVEETTLGSIRVALLNVTEYAQLHSHRMPGWGDLPSEAFEQRHEIKEGGREEDLLSGEDGNEGLRRLAERWCAMAKNSVRLS